LDKTLFYFAAVLAKVLLTLLNQLWGEHQSHQ